MASLKNMQRVTFGASPTQTINARGVIEALGGWSEQAKATIADAMTHSVETGMLKAIASCPVGEKAFERDGENHPGWLKSRNQMDVKGWISETMFEVDLLNDANYALFVNSGTHTQPPQPFFDQGVTASKSAIRSHLNRLKS